ncbi:MAG: VOC family protein [Pseudomonadota bacterium]
MHEANLTRFGPVQYRPQGDGLTRYVGEFKAIDGPAELLISSQQLSQLQITINGERVVDTAIYAGETHRLPINLACDNAIEIQLGGPATAALQLRITQMTQADLGLQCQGYFGLNTSDMQRQRALYKMLGFKGEIYPAGPETSTTFARALGFADDYLIYVSLHSLQDPPTMPFVDTVQFRDESFRDEPPYAALNHLGMTYATYATSNLESDVALLQANGVEFVATPALAPNGERFVFFKDQDGAFFKLVQTEGPVNDSGPNLQKLLNTNMNVSDLERSREFYRLLGFTESMPGAQAGDGEFARAHGFNEHISFDGVDISLGPGTDGATLQLRQWQAPYDADPPYSPPVNHLGIDRINFYVRNVDDAVATMQCLGFEPLGPIGGPPDIGIVFFLDPDGIKVQLAGPRTR